MGRILLLGLLGTLAPLGSLTLSGCAATAGATVAVPMETEHSDLSEVRPVGQCKSDSACGQGFVCCHSAGPSGGNLETGYCATAEMCETVAGEGAH